MPKLNPDDAAFPHEMGYDFKGERVVTASEGMTVRAYIATQSLAGMCANPDISAHVTKQGLTPEQVRKAFAKSAVKQADELIAALNAE